MEQKFMLKEYHTSLTAILLAILPILAPYSLFNTSVLLGDFLILLFCGYIVAFKTKKISHTEASDFSIIYKLAAALDFYHYTDQWPFS